LIEDEISCLKLNFFDFAFDKLSVTIDFWKLKLNFDFFEVEFDFE
jgi:hypothetical protein